MKKVFITAISLQSGIDLGKLVYQPVGFSLKNENRETSFPIISIIEENLEELGETEIIAIRVNNDDTKDNFLKFVEEVESLGLSKECIKTITIPENQNPKTETDLLMQIIEAIPNHSVVNACVTYGTKPISIIVTYALKFIQKLLFDVDIEGIYYGELVRKDRVVVGSKLYNLVCLLQLGEIIDQLQQLNVENPKESLKNLLEI